MRSFAASSNTFVVVSTASHSPTPTSCGPSPTAYDPGTTFRSPLFSVLGASWFVIATNHPSSFVARFLPLITLSLSLSFARACLFLAADFLFPPLAGHCCSVSSRDFPRSSIFPPRLSSVVLFLSFSVLLTQPTLP